MNYLIETVRDATTIHVGGRLTYADGKLWQRCLDEAATAGAARLILDIKELTYVDSGGLGLLLRPLIQSRKTGLNVALRHPGPGVVRLMRMARCDREFPVISA